jgi:AraC-like DNA-binding protein
MDNASRKRWEIWKEHVSARIPNMDFVAGAEYFDAQLLEPVQDSILFMGTKATPNFTIANNAAVKHSGRDYVRIVLPNSGSAYIEQNDRGVLISGNSFAFYDSTVPLKIGSEEKYDYTMLSLPRDSVASLVPNLRLLTATRFEISDAPMRVFWATARSIEQEALRLGVDRLADYQLILSDLLSNALMLRADGPPRYSDLKRAQVMRRLKNRLRDPGLELKEISELEGLSLRSMQRLFQEIGTTPWSWVMENRLLGVAHDLRSAAYARKTVTEIAFSWGLSDPAHFSRSFKARFGCTPSAWRKI